MVRILPTLIFLAVFIPRPELTLYLRRRAAKARLFKFKMP